MESINKINAFCSAYALLDYVYGVFLDDSFSSDEIDYLQNMDDYNDFTFFLFDDEKVIVTESGYVSGTPMDVDDFLKETMSYVKENV